ncbi:MAG: DUF2202 domain-containing protein [Anaerolineales bacterium]|nr:DUF2202 domain-containing protein [Anaerolineales bacterium]
MLNNLKNILIGVFSAIIVVAVGASAYTAFASPDSNEPAAPSLTADYGNGNGNGGTGIGQTSNGNGTGTSVLDVPASDLSPEETAALLFMREEEKLARDVYNALYEVWGQPTFTNIASSEQAHMDEVKLLLDRYNLADPALMPGSFTDPSLQSLYDQLVAQGSISLADALKVGAAIEEIDILDLQERLAQTDNADLQQVFNNLMMGSYNHLNAFTSALLTQTGENYQPQYLSAEAYAAIVTGQSGNGNQGTSGNGQSGQGAQGQGGNGYRGGQNNQFAGVTSAGVPQSNVDITGASIITGTVSAYDLVSLTVQTSDGQIVVVQLGNSQYANSIGFYPQIGQSISVYGFPGDQGLFSAISITLDGQTYAFRDELGRPLWAGGRGNGRGGNH